MIRILLYVAGVLNVAQLIFYGYRMNHGYVFMYIFFVAGIIAGIFVQCGLYVHYKYLQNRNIVNPPLFNGEKPGILGRLFGIGVLCIGKWRKYADTYVGYTFFFFFLPLFPIGCYRYKVVKSGVNSITYNFYGSEKWSNKELFCIYSYFYGCCIWFTALLTSILI